MGGKSLFRNFHAALSVHLVGLRIDLCQSWHKQEPRRSGAPGPSSNTAHGSLSPGDCRPSNGAAPNQSRKLRFWYSPPPQKHSSRPDRMKSRPSDTAAPQWEPRKPLGGHKKAPPGWEHQRGYSGMVTGFGPSWATRKFQPVRSVTQADSAQERPQREAGASCHTIIGRKPMIE